MRRWVEQLLRQYLSPLPPAGPDGQGWPLGRAVRRAELEAVSVQVAGVEYVEDELLLAVPDGSGGWTPRPLVRLEPWEVPRVVQLAVVSGPAPASWHRVRRPTAARGPPARAAASGRVLMNGDRELRILAHPAQWARCSHRGTSLLPDGGVELTWVDTAQPEPLPGCEPSVPAGLAFDRWCQAHATGPLTGAAVDDGQRLYVADTCEPQHPRRRPLGRPPAAADRRRPAGTALSSTARRGGGREARGRPRRRAARPAAPRRPPAPATVGRSSRSPVALRSSGRKGWPSGATWCSCCGRTPTARTPSSAAPTVPRSSGCRGRPTSPWRPTGPWWWPGPPDQSFRRWESRGGTWIELTPLRAEGYDGGAVTVAPDGRVAFTTRAGWSTTNGSAATYAAAGEVRSYRLDSGAYRTRWGRVFVEGCIPPGTSVTLRFVTTDEDVVLDPLRRERPDRGAAPVPDVDAPPLPSQALLDALSEPGRLVERSEPRWPGDPAGAVFETPVHAPAGRYLWVVADLVGTTHASPRVTALAVEAPGHRLDRALPRTWTSGERDAAYLQRFLAPAEGLLHDLDSRAALRAVLLDPTASPTEALAWLGSFLGLVLDERWPEDARRELVESAFDLFRIRGTQSCLERLLRLYLRVPVAVVENWRLRGLGGGVLSAPTTGPRPPAVGSGTPLAGQLGRFAVGGLLPDEDGYTATAHRFTVLVGADLDPARLEVVQHIVETHKPAHTLAEICQFGSGMRLGASTRVGLSAFVGPGTGWGPAVVGRVNVGGDGIVGVPTTGSRVAETSYVGEVRIG